LSDRVYAKIKLALNYHGIGSVVALLVRVFLLPPSARSGSARDPRAISIRSPARTRTVPA
jgi:hypothetical protein